MSIAIVEAVIDGWNRKDLDAIVSHFSPEAVWHNIPMPARVGREAIADAIGSFLARVEGVDWETTSIAVAQNGSVLTERMDRFHLASGAIAEVPVMGIFDFADGKIVAWRDYFDLGMLQSEMGK